MHKFSSLTLSPALAVILLRPHDAPRVLGQLFWPFNHRFHQATESYQRGVTQLLGHKLPALMLYLLLAATALKVPGISDEVEFPGLSIAGFSATPNEGLVFFGLAPFEQRTSADLGKDAILARVNGALQQIKGARMFVVPPPAVEGVGKLGQIYADPNSLPCSRSS